MLILAASKVFFFFRTNCIVTLMYLVVLDLMLTILA